MYSQTKSTFVVSIDLICYELSKKSFLELLEKNEKFKNYYLKNLSARLQTLKKQEYSNDMSGFMVARVCEIFLNKICLVDENTSIKDAIIKSIDLKTSTIVVQKDYTYGVITDSLLKKDVLLKNMSLDEKVIKIANFPFLCVDNDDFLFQVLLVLTKHTIKRVGVLKDNVLIGTIDQIDILSYFANHVHLIASQINKAENLDELKKASLDISKSVKSLFSKSVGTLYIAKMVSELNAKIYQKIFELTIPKDLQEHCAFIVMGSEGRNEQILKTDQDNALIVKDGIDVEQYRVHANEITATLIDFGFPRCEGNIMLSNPYWCRSEKEYSTVIFSWLNAKGMEDYMDLAIFFDAKTVAGDGILLDKLKDVLFSYMNNNDVFMAFFAKSTLAFDTPIGIFSNLKAKDDEIDLKKGAIFAIVQGVRSLALEHKLTELSTVARIKRLKELEVLSSDMSAELIEAFGLLLRLKLQGQMLLLKDNKQINNKINISNLSKMQRDMIKDSFIIVNNFKKFISFHFKLNNIA